MLGETFRNRLMSDGCWGYREVDQRPRCLAHLIRKAHGLEESFDAETERFGTHTLQVIETCRKRAALPWTCLAEVIRQQRKSLPAPPLPLAAT